MRLSCFVWRYAVKAFILVGCFLIGMVCAISNSTAATPPAATDSTDVVKDWPSVSSPAPPAPPAMKSMGIGCYGTLASNGQVAKGMGISNTSTSGSSGIMLQSFSCTALPGGSSVGVSEEINFGCGYDTQGNQMVPVGITFSTPNCYLICATPYTPSTACQWGSSATFPGL